MSHSFWKRQIHWAFAPAAIAIAVRWHAFPSATQLMAAAFALFAVEQAWMARVDLLAAARVRAEIEAQADLKRSSLSRMLDRFDRVVAIAIALELCGFYGASVDLGWGALGVLLALAGFNAFVPVRLVPGSDRPVREIARQQRWALTAVDLGAIALVGVWIAGRWRGVIAVTLLTCVVAFELVKYGAMIWTAMRRSLA
ncbi:MAG: hypothetical protein AAFX40_00380 [Cyanobacteria bacterium J06639_1]